MKDDERATGGRKSVPISGARKRAVGILISCLGLVMVASFLISGILGKALLQLFFYI